MYRATTWFLPLLLWAAAAFPSDQWDVDRSNSKLAFIASYDGVGFETVFERFDAAIRFDPADAENGRFDVSVDMTSINSRSADRDEGMQGAEWFATEAHPEATFVTRSFRRTAENRFEAVGDLTIKGVTREIRLPFTWTSTGERAELQAETTLTRTDFQIGTGEWESDGTIGFEVKVLVDLALRR